MCCDYAQHNTPYCVNIFFVPVIFISMFRSIAFVLKSICKLTAVSSGMFYLCTKTHHLIKALMK